MLEIYVRNTTKCKPISDYEYIVMVNAEKIAEGTIKSHKRKDGWVKLVRRIVEQEEEENG